MINCSEKRRMIGVTPPPNDIDLTLLPIDQKQDDNGSNTPSDNELGETSSSLKISCEESTNQQLNELRNLFPKSFGSSGDTESNTTTLNLNKNDTHDLLKRKKQNFNIKFDPSTQRTHIPTIITNFEKKSKEKYEIVDMREPGKLDQVIEKFSDDRDRQEQEKLFPSIKSQTHNINNQDQDASDLQDDNEEKLNRLGLPISHEIFLSGHTRLISGLTLNSSGSRLLSGSYDSDVRVQDFAVMDKSFRSRSEITIEEGYPVVAVKQNKSGKKFLACTGSSQAKFYDRNGEMEGETVKGDMYIRDMRHTFGHVTALNGGCQNPIDDNIFLTQSVDGTLRTQNTQKLKRNLSVFKLRNTAGGRQNCTAGAYSFDARTIIGASNDGSIQIFDTRFPLRQARFIKHAHEPLTETSSICMSHDNNWFYSRGGDNTVKMQDIRLIKGGSSAVSSAVHVIENLRNDFISTDMILSPDQQFLVTGTSSIKDSGMAGKLVFISKSQKKIVHEANISTSSVTSIAWNPKINQIVVGSTDSTIRVLYNPKLSKKGALLCAGKKVRRTKSDVVGLPDVGEIIIPIVTRSDDFKLPVLPPQQYAMDRRDAVKTQRPELPINGPNAQDGRLGVETFAEHVARTNKMKYNLIRTQDPREALLRYDAKTKADPVFLGRAYSKTQPGQYLDTNEYDSEDNLIENKADSNKFSDFQSQFNSNKRQKTDQENK